MEIAIILAGVMSLTSKEIETSVQSLSFTCIGNATGTDPQTILASVLGGTEINIQKQDSNDTQTLIQSIKLLDLAEICTHNEGVVLISHTGGVATISFSIEISKGGALLLNDNAKLMLSLNSVPAATVITIDGVDHPEATKAFVKYESKFVNENVGKDFDIDAAYAMAVPVEEIKVLEMTYKNGKNVKMSQREVKQVLTDSQDTIYVRNGLVTLGYGKFAVLSVEHAVSMRITLATSTNFYLLKDQIT